MNSRKDKSGSPSRSTGFFLVAGFIGLALALCAGAVPLLGAGYGLEATIMLMLAGLGTFLLVMGIKGLRHSRVGNHPIGQERPIIGNAVIAVQEDAITAEETEAEKASRSEQVEQSANLEKQQAAETTLQNDSQSETAPAPSRKLPPHLELRSNSTGALIAREHVKTVHRMLSRSEDVFATAKDLANTRKSINAFSMLAEMLAHSDALLHPDPPTIKPIRLTRTGRMWLGSDVSIATDETYDAVVSLEAAFNIHTDMLLADGARPSTASWPIQKKACRAISESSRLSPDYNCKVDYGTMAYGNLIPNESEWALRERMANAVENASMPFRLIFDMKTNARENIAAISLEIPRPTCFSIISEDKITQEALARDYAFRTTLFMAESALGAMRNPDSKHAVITCHARGETAVRLSLDVVPRDLPTLQKIADQMAPMPMPSLPNLRMTCANDWLDVVDPHIDFDDPLLNPQFYTDPVETSKQQCSPLLAQAANIQEENELGTFEGAARQKAWANLESRLGATAESAVSVTKDLREKTHDLAVREACDRVMRALVDGTANPDDVDELERTFHGNNQLEDMLRFCTNAYASRQRDQIEQAVSKLGNAITPSMQISMMDDTESAFRYFRSTAERLAYNLHSEDDRHVRLVSKTYYTANEMMAYLLCSLDRPDEAQPYADETMRIAPLSANAVITKARVLEEQMRVFEAIDLLNEAIPKCATVSDAALCYYRMAYLQWNIGCHITAIACYCLSIALHTDIERQAQSELDELMDSDGGLQSLSVEKAIEVLEIEGLNTWPASKRKEEIAKAAVLCTDEGLYRPAQSLALSLLEFVHDDALIDVCRSFSPSE